MTRTARCACGNASITVSGEPEVHAICHCANCKRRTGSAFGVSAYFKRTDVVEIKGAMTVYAFRHPRKEQDQERHFCSACGTTLLWTISTMPELVGIAAGCFEDAAFGEPTLSVSHGRKLPWVSVPDGWRIVQH